MKLSDAIRKGGTMAKQGTSQVYNRADGTVCALGAAVLGAGETMHSDDEGWRKVSELFPYINHVLVYAPGRERPLKLIEAIWQMNDVHHMTFDKIADVVANHGL